MPFATRLTKVRDRSEHFDERTGMCYHQAPPTERVVVHVRDAAQAKPHLEHNPLSLLGACYAIPLRKLNDPGRCGRRSTTRWAECARTTPGKVQPSRDYLRPVKRLAGTCTALTGWAETRWPRRWWP